MSDLEQQLARVAAMRKQLKEFRMIGSGGVTVHGDMQKGYAIGIDGGGDTGGGGGGGDVPGCTDPAASNYNPSATVDDGSCVYPVPGCTDPEAINYNFDATFDDGSCMYQGACCASDGSCTISAPSDCSDTYQGNNTVCDPNPCPNGCPFINLTCDSISASKSKCGYTEWGTPSDPPKYYLTHTGYQEVFSRDLCDGICTLLRDGLCNGTVTVDPVTCVSTCTGSCDATHYDCAGISSVEHLSDYCGDEYPFVPVVSTTRREDHFSGTGSCAGNTDNVQTLSNEYTTAQLISNVESALPAYSGSYTGGACASSRFLSSDEITYSIQRSKPKFDFVAATIAFMLCYNEHFVPADGSAPSDTPKCITVSIGDVEAFGDEMLEPSTNGTTTVEDITCTPL